MESWEEELKYAVDYLNNYEFSEAKTCIDYVLEELGSEAENHAEVMLAAAKVYHNLPTSMASPELYDEEVQQAPSICDITKGNLRKAIEYAEKAMNINPAMKEEALDIIVLCYNFQAEKLFTIGEESLSHSRLNQSIGYLEELIKMNPAEESYRNTLKQVKELTDYAMEGSNTLE